MLCTRLLLFSSGHVAVSEKNWLGSRNTIISIRSQILKKPNGRLHARKASWSRDTCSRDWTSSFVRAANEDFTVFAGVFSSRFSRSPCAESSRWLSWGFPSRTPHLPWASCRERLFRSQTPLSRKGSPRPWERQTPWAAHRPRGWECRWRQRPRRRGGRGECFRVRPGEPGIERSAQ